MNLLKKTWLRLTKFRFEGEASLDLKCDSCGYVLLRRLLGLEFEEYFVHPERFEGQVCHSCGEGHFTVRLHTEKGFRKKYPHHMQGG